MKNKQSRGFLKLLAHKQTAHPILILIALIAITVLMSIPAQGVRTVASLEQMMPAETPEIAAFNDLRDQGLGRDAIAIILQIDADSTYARTTILDEQTLAYMQRVETQLAQQTSVTHIQSPTQNTDGLLNEDKTELLLLAYTDAAGDDARMKRLASYTEKLVIDAGVPAGTQVRITGTPIIQQKLGEYIQYDQRTTRIASTLLVLLITAILFGLSSSVIPIIIVTLSVSWLYGTMGLLDLPISTLAGGVAAMVIGIGIDFAIHLMNKFKYERKTGLSIPEAIEQAVVHTGTALSATALTTTAAFLSFLIGVMPEMGRFGILMALGITYALILSLFGLPALLVLEERIIAYIKGHAHFGIEGEYRLEDEDCDR